MTLYDLLTKLKSNGKLDKFTLLVQHYGIVGNSSLEREYYTDTPIFDSREISKDFKDYIVLIPFHKPFDIGRIWKYWDITTIVVTTLNDLRLHYSDNQLAHWLEWLDNNVRKEVFQYCL